MVSLDNYSLLFLNWVFSSSQVQISIHYALPWACGELEEVFPSLHIHAIIDS